MIWAGEIRPLSLLARVPASGAEGPSPATVATAFAGAAACLGDTIEVAVASTDAGAPDHAACCTIATAAGERWLIAIEPDYLARLLDRLFGGSGSPSRRTARLSAGERHALTSFAAAFAQALGLSADVETGAWPEEGAVATWLRLDCAATGAPLALLGWEGVCPRQELAPDPNATAAWRSAVAAAPIQLTALVARAQFPAARLAGLAPGDVLPLRLAAQAELHAGGKRLAHARVGAADGRAAVEIASLEATR